MTSRTIAYAVTRRPVDDAVAVQRLGHEQEVPLILAGSIDGILPELIGQSLRKVAAQPGNTGLHLLLRGHTRLNPGFLHPKDGVVCKVFPQLLRVRRQRLQPVVLAQVALEPLALPFAVETFRDRSLYERIVYAEEEVGRIPPLAEVDAIRSLRHIVVCHADKEGRRLAIAPLLRVPRRTHLGYALAWIDGSAIRTTQIHLLRHNADLGIPGRVIEGAVQHDADAGIVVGIDKVLKLDHGILGRGRFAQHRIHLPIILHRIG